MSSPTVRKYLVLTFVAGLSFLSSPVFAQPPNREIVNQSIEWFSITSSIKIHKRINLIQEGQFRFVSGLEPMQMQWRTAAEIVVGKNFSFVPLGYVYTWNYLYGEQPSSFANNEHRIWQQVVYKHHVGRVSMNHRVRLEQRYIQVHSKESNGEIVDHGYDLDLNRIRYRFGISVPLNHAKLEPKTFFICAYDEAFLSWGTGVTFHEPDQNRIFLGLGYQFTGKTNLQLGSLYQMLIKNNGAKQENNVGVQVMLTRNFDLTKKTD